MDDLLFVFLEPLFDFLFCLFAEIMSAIFGALVFGGIGYASLRQGKIQTVFDGDPFFRQPQQ